MRRLIAIAVLIGLVEGCYTSTVRVDSIPPGAQVHYDYQPKGVTPVEFPVDFLGAHKITLDHPDYGRREEIVDLRAPAYLWFPLDFVATITPGKFTDRHSFTFDLTEKASSEMEAQNDESEGTEKQ
ncbi:MAG: PEGA domain-containing protein [Candidatus Omnitrophica bacterium]|nr:PEGA domain-containing protein [Candidatus Omnitrophota bacterium]